MINEVFESPSVYIISPRLYKSRCRCKEKEKKKKKKREKRNFPIRREGRPLPYPYSESDQITFKTFQIQYPKKLSLTAKFLFNSFQNKYLYYAIDDILDTFKASPIERDHLLDILYSPVLFLQNHFCINFFDIWIHSVCIEEIFKPNKFLKKESEVLNPLTLIKIQVFYKTKVPVKPQEALW